MLGGLSDRFGRKPVVVMSLLGASVNYLLLAWAPTLAWLFLGRIISARHGRERLGGQRLHRRYYPAGAALLRFGLVGATFGFGFVLGPAMGGVLGAIGPAAAVRGRGGAGPGQRDLWRADLAGEPAAGAAPGVFLAAR